MDPYRNEVGAFCKAVLLPCEELDDLKAKIDRYRQEGRKP